MSIGPLAYGSSTSAFALRNLHKSPGRRGSAARCICGARTDRGRSWPAAIGAGFVRLATGRARIRPVGARGLTGRRRARHVRRPPRAHEKRDSCSKNAVWERLRGLGLRSGLDDEAANWENARRPHSGGRPRCAKPPPGASVAPRFCPRSQFLNANGKIWVQPRPPRRRTSAGAGAGPADAARQRSALSPASCSKETPTRNRARPAGPADRAHPKREGALRGQNPPSL